MQTSLLERYKRRAKRNAALFNAVSLPLIEWRDARQAIFEVKNLADGQNRSELWARLAKAEAALMQVANEMRL